jgi:hypothetical protein
VLSYTFDTASAAFLSEVAISGSTFKFLKSTILLPAEWTATSAPTYYESATGFLVSSPISQSFTVHMISQVTLWSSLCLHAACIWQQLIPLDRSIYPWLHAFVWLMK